MTRRIILIGGGEHAAVVAETVRAHGGWELVGFVDPRPGEDRAPRIGAPYLGGDDALARWPDAELVLGAGAVKVSTIRARIVDRLPHRRWASPIHPRAYVAPSARIGAGAVIMAGAMVQAGVRVGAHAVINTGAVVEHDTLVGDLVQVGPGAVLGGGVRIGPGAFVGLGARVRDHVEIGADAMIAMGAVVVADVAAQSTVMGVPARRVA
jgi:acetyltransferase EpsM